MVIIKKNATKQCKNPSLNLCQNTTVHVLKLFIQMCIMFGTECGTKCKIHHKNNLLVISQAIKNVKN